MKHNGDGWRVQGRDGHGNTREMGPFDELVVGDFIHIEMMDDDTCYFRIGKECGQLNMNTGEILSRWKT